VGLWGKTGSVIVVTMIGFVDIGIGLMVNYAYYLPFEHRVLISPFVIAWYILAEVGSIIENLGAMGIPIPPFLARHIETLQRRIGDTNTDE